MSRTERNYLAGQPSNRLVATIRRELKRFGIVPREPHWSLAWKWANTVRHSYYYSRWPTSNEIGAQYLVLVLADMQRNHMLKLPFRAFKMPAEVAAILPKSTPDILRLTEERELAALENEPLTITVEAQ